MYRNDFLKNILLMTVFLLLLVGCESKDKTEESKEHDHHDHSESLSGSIDEHTLGAYIACNGNICYWQGGTFKDRANY